MTRNQQKAQQRTLSFEVARWRREDDRRRALEVEATPADVEPADVEPAGPPAKYEPEWARRHRLKREEEIRVSKAFALGQSTTRGTDDQA